MPATLRIVATLLCALIAGPLLAQTGEHARVIVKYRSGMVTAQSVRDGQPSQGQRTRTLASRHNLPLEAGTTIADRTSVVQASGISSAELASRLAADPDVEMVVPDYQRHALEVPNDPYYPNGIRFASPTAGQWYLRSPSSLLVSAINTEAAWDITHGSSSVVIAMLDTGVRYDHPDLKGKLLPGRDFVSLMPNANDGDGWDADPSDPGDWITDTEAASKKLGSNCVKDNSTWHGTQTAGIAGAMTNNLAGMAGAGRNVMLLPVRVLGKCGGLDSDIISAMRWAAGLSVIDASGNTLPTNPYPARIINLSVGSAPELGVDNCAAYRSTINELTNLGIVVVAAAGNDGMAVSIPGACTGVLAVGAVNHSGTKTIYSNLGREIAISAPGGDEDPDPNALTLPYALLTTSNSGTQQPGAYTYTGSGADATIGTSFSAPLVSGTIGLMLSVNPNLQVAQVRSLLQSSARAFPTSGVSSSMVPVCSSSTSTEQKECYCTTTTCGQGMLDASAAISATAAGMPVARLVTYSVNSPNSAEPSVNTQLSITGDTSRGANGAAINAYAWLVTSGADQVKVASGLNSSTLTLDVVGSGSFTVQLTITDTSNASASASQTFNLKTVPASATTSGGSSSRTSSSTGGGALDARWLIGLAAAVLALARRRRWSGG